MKEWFKVKNEKMDQKTRKVVTELKNNISHKYDLEEMYLFGSAARGDNSPDSDIDIFVCLSKVNRTIEEDIFDTTFELEMKYDCVIDIFVFDKKIQSGVYAQIPFYKNVL